MPIIENGHEAIISKIDFNTVQKVLAADTRRSATRDTVLPFSGLILCGECGNSMMRHTVTANGLWSGKKDEMHNWISEFLKHENLATIESSVIVTFIDNILIYADKRVEIVFRWRSECDWLETALAKEIK